MNLNENGQLHVLLITRFKLLVCVCISHTIPEGMYLIKPSFKAEFYAFIERTQIAVAAINNATEPHSKVSNSTDNRFRSLQESVPLC